MTALQAAAAEGKAPAPTPAIGGVGLIPDWTKTADIKLKRDGDLLILIGHEEGHLGQSLYQLHATSRSEGAPPPVDLIEERENGDFVRALIGDGTATAAHDLSDGGLAVALAEMAMASGIGAVLSEAPADIPAHAYWFGEDQARYLVTVPAAQAQAVLARAQGIDMPIVAEVYRVLHEGKDPHAAVKALFGREQKAEDFA